MAEITQAEEEEKEAEEIPEQEEIEEEQVVHTNVMFDGTLPGPSDKVPTVLHQTNFETQRKLAKDLYEFLSEDEASKLELNTDTSPRVALINIPLTQKVRVVYSMGFGSKGIGATSKVANKFLFLSGDGGLGLFAGLTVFRLTRVLYCFIKFSALVAIWVRVRLCHQSGLDGKFIKI